MSNGVGHELVQKSLIGEALEHGPMAIFVADEDGRYLAVNAYACELLGYTRDQLLALRVSEVAVNPGAKADFDEMSGRLRARALGLMRQLDEGGGYREQIAKEVQERLSDPSIRLKADTPGLCECGTQNDPDAKFCKNCGAKL